MRSKAKKAGVMYAAYKNKTLLNKMSRITRIPCYAHLRSTHDTGVLN
jgi:hypothetical protein